jgi:hypothetical protein
MKNLTFKLADNEKWVQGFEGIYSVDMTGSVNSYHRKKKKKLKCYNNSSGYLIVDFYKDRKRKQYIAHRLIAETLIPNPENKPEVNHIDGDKTNNDISNLEWNTRKENICHAFSTGLKNSEHLRRAVVQLDKATKEVIVKYNSITDAHRQTGINRSSITSTCQGKRETAGEFIWRYAG